MQQTLRVRLLSCRWILSSSFSARLVPTVSSLTPFNRPTKANVCPIRHRLTFLPQGQCKESVVYSFPMKCGKVYVGQTRNCAIARLRQHNYAVARSRTTASRTTTDEEDSPFPNNVVQHVKSCELVPSCGPDLPNSSILAVEPNLKKRLMLETFLIYSTDHCISSPSLVFSQSERNVLRCWLIAVTH